MLRILSVLTVSLLFMSCGSDSEDAARSSTRQSEAMAEEEVMMPERSPEMVLEDLDLRAIGQLGKGDTYSIQVNDSLSFNFEVQGKNEYVKGIQSLRATLTGGEQGVVTISIQQDTLNGTILVPGKDWYWALYLDPVSGKHIVTKKEQDRIQGSEPLQPEDQE